METLGAERSRIHAALGPCISRKNYEVGAEFVSRYSFQRDAGNKRYFETPEGENAKPISISPPSSATGSRGLV